MKQYKHTQIGYLILFLLGVGLFIFAFLIGFYGFNWIFLIVLIVLAICMVLFSTLTVEIIEDSIRVQFGSGIIRKSFQLKDIESCRIVKNPWYYGWGIRITPHGWLYNVSGLFAVELKMKSGKKYRIGTDEPEKLVEAIQYFLK